MWTASARDRRQGCSNPVREIRCAIGSLRGLVDQGALPQFDERQGRLDSARVVKVAVDQAIEEMADVEPALPTGGIRVTYDVDRAAIAQQVIEFRAICEFVDPGQIDEEQPTHVFGRGVEAIEVRRLETVVG